MIVTGSSLDDTEKAIALARRHPRVLRATAGVHPHHAAGLPDVDAGRLEALLADPFVVAAGECGLDYFRNFSPPAEQRRAFELQLRVADTAGKPLFLHQRDAHVDFIAMLRAHPHLAARGVLHCFTGRDRGTRGLPRARPVRRHHRLDLRRAARPGTARSNAARADRSG